jgi:hypothetical protein
MSKQLQVQEWVDEFAASVVGHHEAILKGDRRASNRFASRTGAAFQKLREVGDAGRDALASLFVHSRPDVRMAAAAYLLRHKTTDAVTILTQLAAGEGLAAFEAQQTLERWKEGTWSLDPE